MKLIRKTVVGCGLLTACLGACTKTSMDAYKKYMEGGEITYPGRADTVLVQSGYNRAQLAVVLGNDPLVNSIRVFWNNRLDSLDTALEGSSPLDTVRILIPDLVEGNYNFVIYTFDAERHQSVAVNASGTVYGQSYLNSLSNRVLHSAEASTDGSRIELSWGEAASGELGIEVNYTGQNGQARLLLVQPSETHTELPDYQESSELRFRSLYKPDSAAFETFSPPYSSITLPAFERQLDKSRFQIVVLPSDVLEGGYGWLMNYLWDESYNPPGFATQDQIPGWFTFDSGESASISRFKVWQANDRLYDKESVKTFELYGSNNPAQDGSWDSWTKLGSYTSVKPSGLPVGQLSDADIAFAEAGEEFTVAAGVPKFRYFRFKLLSNWGDSSFMTMEEFTFYTHDR